MRFKVKLKGFAFIVHTWMDESRRLEPEWEADHRDPSRPKAAIVSTPHKEEEWIVEAASEFEVGARFKRLMGIRSAMDEDPRTGEPNWEITCLDKPEDAHEPRHHRKAKARAAG